MSVADSNRNRVWTPEMRASHGATTKKRHEEQGHPMKGRSHTEETKALMRAAPRPRHTTETVEGMRQRMLNEPYDARKKRMLALRSKPTSIEVILGEMLREAFPEEELIREYLVWPWTVDWALPALRLAYEADGTYWHGLPGRADTDLRKNAALTALGWTVVRFSEDELVGVARGKRI